jgi:FlaG/FlaF family flagellin (archaellin)
MRHIKRHIRRNVKAISPVLAVLMMIAVAIGGSLVVYAWVMGYIGLSTERSGQAIMIQSIANDATDTDLLVFVQNIGEGVVQLDGSSCLYINGEIVNCTITGGTVSDEGLTTLDKGETATITYTDGAALPGQKVTAKVTTLLGTATEAHEYPAGSARETSIYHFVFDEIGDQISGKSFSIKIELQNQYGDVLFDYTSTCTLVYSGGTITPEETNAFDHGKWEGTVTVNGPANGATITATSPYEGYTGTSDPFDVDSPVMFVSAGGGGKGGSSVEVGDRRSPTYPPDLEEDDLILLQIGIRDGTNSPDGSQLAAAGFALLYADQSSSTGMGQWIYYKFSDGTETGSLTIPINGNPTNVVSCMYAFRYVATSSFNEDGSFDSQESDVIYAEDVTTYGSRRLAVSFIYMKGYESTVGEFTGETGGDWIKQAEFQNSITGSYEDAAIQLQTAEMLTAGTISGGSCREDIMDAHQKGWGVRAFALIPRD